jgi:hypothetical protein
MGIDEIMATTKTRKSTITRALNEEHPQQVRGAFAAVLRRITVQEPERLHRVANVLFEQAEEGNLNAITILFDRLDGRPHQAIEMEAKVDITQKNAIVDSLLKTIESRANVD